jgi:hypothetical protein
VSTRWVVVRGVAAVYAIAFVSFAVQALPLIGSRGIAPAAEWLSAAREQVGFFDTPTLLWWNASDTAILSVCGAGLIASVAVMVGVWPRVTLAACWLLYLSIVNAGSVFMHYQWDALLLETGLLAVLYAPRGGLPPLHGAAPSLTTIGLMRFLLFRLMWLSGVVKLASGDTTWRSLRALDYHYFTQPLPPWTAYFMQQLPVWFQRASCALMFVVELVLPFLIWAPWRLRRWALAGIAGLQLLILATGNYGFFNLLALVLCASLLPHEGTPAPRMKWRVALAWAFAAVAVIVTTNEAVERFAGETFLSRAAAPLAPLQSFNSYGLFAVMTTERKEITLQGSADGTHWQTYDFRYKPGALDRWPRFVARPLRAQSLVHRDDAAAARRSAGTHTALRARAGRAAQVLAQRDRAVSLHRVVGAGCLALRRGRAVLPRGDAAGWAARCGQFAALNTNG